MVVVDHGLMKGVILAPCSKTIDAAGITQLFFDFVFKRFGLHDTLISNQGPQFTSAFVKELACLLKYDVRLSTAYHPQTDSQTDVGARGYLRSQNHFPLIFRIPPVAAQDPIVSHVNPMLIQDLTVCTRLVPP